MLLQSSDAQEAQYSNATTNPIQLIRQDSIAHIVRKPGYGIDLQLDSWEQARHLHDIGSFLQCVARYRLENEYTMKASNDTKIFRYINENELQ